MERIRRGYVDTRWGQLHYREAGRSTASPPLFCLHATAYSGRTFDPIVPLLTAGRRVVALDTPGYGGSDAPAEPPRFEAYAAVLGEAIVALAGDSPVDLFGYHTGALLAVEIASSRPAAARKMVLIGVPFFEGADRLAWRGRLVHETTLAESLAQFDARWDYFVTHRTPGLSLARAFECFVDELSVYPREWWAHAALFDYAAGERLRRVAADVLVINPASALAAASSHAASLMPNARVVEAPELSGAIFDLGTARLASLVTGFLDA